MSGMNAATIGPTEQDVLEFGAKWGCDDASIAMVMTMPPPVQASILQRFNPPPGQNNSGKLVKFAEGALRVAKQRLQTGETGGKGEMGGKGWKGEKGGKG